MLYHCASYLLPLWGALNVVHYVSFRACIALFTSFLLFLMGGRFFIRTSQTHFRALAREETPDTHRLKDNTPTMGGVFIIAVITATVLLWANLADFRVWTMLVTLWGFGLVGAWDDWAKITQNKGISEGRKFIAQSAVSALLVFFWGFFVGPSTELVIPIFKSLTFDLGLFFYLWAVWVILCTVNAVNFTDGLDGLATIALIFNFFTFGIIAYLVGHVFFALYLYVPFAGTAELAVVAAALIGALLGFLWYNSYPAQMFMGDVGSLALGGAFAMMALMSKQECLIPIAGGLFVVEGISVVVQMASFRFFKRRFFKMAPLHHHFEMLGWPETKITIRFAIVTLLLCLLALMTLKLR